ncbi:hypothetical protein PVAG01_04859 [Phlyctema vagabunda]|uniref:Alpha/beta-hydrolase n=1 Tax=Phlyctema vagabunda TaxID=108571 RepID=A0ABR4PJ34_9HELO
MVRKTTHTFSTASSPIPLNLDIYHPRPRGDGPRNGPAMLYFHGGGVVAMDRSLVPRHIVQSCLKRGWPLVSADYEKLPNSTGMDIVRNIKEAYAFVREDLRRILYGEDGLWEEVLVGGISAGAYLTFLAANHLSPSPLAILTYYGPGSCSHPFFTSSNIISPPRVEASEVSHLLSSTERTVGKTPPWLAFNPLSILESGDRNLEFAYPEVVEIDWRKHEGFLYPYFVQENKMPELCSGADIPLHDDLWTRDEFPDAVIIHGTDDDTVPFILGEAVKNAIGDKARFFPVPGAGHSFDSGSFLGDPPLEIVEEAWRALDEIMERKLGADHGLKN